jgi:(p)ppGpp synthase/HD superfamily hydrolase
MYRYPRLHQALDYAADAHSDQSRKGTAIPYLSHPMGVASLVLEHGGSEDQAIAGLLHDVLEDCGGQHEPPIRLAFGDAVADMVLGCTDGLPDAAGDKPPWKARKLAYLAHLEEADEGTVLVSACDKLHNARAIVADLMAGEAVFERFKAGRVGTLWYYGALHAVFAERMGDGHSLVLQLGAAVNQMGGGNS